MGDLVIQSDSEQRKTPNSYEGGFSVVPRVDLEPTHPGGYWILNPMDICYFIVKTLSPYAYGYPPNSIPQSRL